MSDNTSKERHLFGVTLLYNACSINAQTKTSTKPRLFFFFLSFGKTAPPPHGPGPPHSRGISITHNDTPQSAGFLWTSDQLVALTTHNTHNRHPSMPPVGFEPVITAGDLLQTYALDRTAPGTGKSHFTVCKTSKESCTSSK